MQLACIESELERLAWSQQMTLPDDFAQSARSQAFGQRHIQRVRGLGAGLEQVVSRQ